MRRIESDDVRAAWIERELRREPQRAAGDAVRAEHARRRIADRDAKQRATTARRSALPIARRAAAAVERPVTSTYAGPPLGWSRSAMAGVEEELPELPHAAAMRSELHRRGAQHPNATLRKGDAPAG